MNRISAIFLNSLCIIFPLGIIITIWAYNSGYKNQSYIFGFWTIIGFAIFMS
jgi:hypothetical protein